LREEHEDVGEIHSMAELKMRQIERKYKYQDGREKADWQPRGTGQCVHICKDIERQPDAVKMTKVEY
jgi:hypothetical protein